MKATAAVLRAADGPYVIEEVELDPPGPGEVLVRVVSAGMCHTDVVPRQPGAPAPPPIITGHEGAGVVEAVGEGVTRVAVGDHVVLSFDSCGDCPSCRRGVPPYCDWFLFRNLFGRRLDGTTGVRDASGAEVASRWFGQSSFATHCVAAERCVVVVDSDLPLEKLGPLGCGLLTGAGSVFVDLAVREGSSFVVFGAGAVGLAAIMAAKVAGASTIIAVDLHRHRLDLATELGATHVLDGAGLDLAQVRDLTGGGADYSFDTTGNVAVIANAVGALRMGGHCGLVGIQTEPITFDAAALVGKTVSGILEGGADAQVIIPRLIELWRAGRFPFDRLIETFPLEAINTAEEASMSGKVIKPVLLPSARP
ncbi:NAD(P)-dependent alcohol dehydrogenase [Frankia sp. CNm7]|uniref:NAD(P)-dependent alcohol dehydrogenase n=1 Tax=Frankia nepalensis TaxID=1836974 RepID=A0A937RVL1_9ACTN|nr:NAD(P)-dependent alcohol dehydrogenase [Frankia nepalensis]MBL7501173.1 NAD(P)-dependent alcohol dehydrogenase [Frankia nepalensis]MBL7512625.1 NAD(P)-dependent alcohol dehydrogenase [Frankia nepalensis]MBL7520043.1 NAD(P)-dependent alcohol dehydrogenase [Frankia nepalensis]MBL7632681.1 NAD(P)-dependent alcohol dehydrogenase [Frankia nepalensis]